MFVLVDETTGIFLDDLSEAIHGLGCCLQVKAFILNETLWSCWVTTPRTFYMTAEKHFTKYPMDDYAEAAHEKRN